MASAFVCLEVECWTMPDLVELLLLISENDEAEQFMAAYTETCGESTAIHNLRYMLGLVESRYEGEAERLADLFMVEVPKPSETLSPRHTFGMSSLGVEDKPVPDWDALEESMELNNGDWAKGKSGHFNVGVQDSPKRGASKKARKPLTRKMIEGRPE